MDHERPTELGGDGQRGRGGGGHAKGVEVHLQVSSQSSEKVQQFKT